MKAVAVASVVLPLLLRAAAAGPLGARETRSDRSTPLTVPGSTVALGGEDVQESGEEVGQQHATAPASSGGEEWPPSRVASRGSVAVVSVIKNEGDVLAEWLDHHLAEGVSRFLLVDDNSTDATVAVLDMYASFVTVVRFEGERPKTGFQVVACRRALKKNPLAEEWLAFIDADEYLWAPYSLTIPEVLEQVPSEAGQVLTPWVMHGSSGHVEQPPSVIGGFTRRSDRLATGTHHVKALVRRTALRQVFIHSHDVGAAWTLGPDLATQVPWSGNLFSVDAATLVGKFDLLRLNHYPIMSLGRFRKVKQQRGDVMGSKNIRTEGYFRRYDLISSDLVDNSLMRKRNLCRRDDDWSPLRTATAHSIALVFHGPHVPHVVAADNREDDTSSASSKEQQHGAFFEEALYGFDVIRSDHDNGGDNATLQTTGALVASLASRYAAVAVLQAQEATFSHSNAFFRSQLAAVTRCRRLLFQGAAFCTLDLHGFVWRSTELLARPDPAADADAALQFRGSWPSGACVAVVSTTPGVGGGVVNVVGDQHRHRLRSQVALQRSLDQPILSGSLVEPLSRQILRPNGDEGPLGSKTRNKLVLTLSLPPREGGLFRQVDSLVAVACLAKLLGAELLFPASLAAGPAIEEGPPTSAFNIARSVANFRAAGVQAASAEYAASHCESSTALEALDIERRVGLPAYGLRLGSVPSLRHCGDDVALLRLDRVDAATFSRHGNLPPIGEYAALARVLVNAMEPSTPVLAAIQAAKDLILGRDSPATSTFGGCDSVDLFLDDDSGTTECPLCRLDGPGAVDALYVGSSARGRPDDGGAALAAAVARRCAFKGPVWNWDALRRRLPDLSRFSPEQQRIFEGHLMQDADFFWGARRDSGLTNYVTLRRWLRGKGATSAVASTASGSGADAGHAPWLSYRHPSVGLCQPS